MFGINYIKFDSMTYVLHFVNGNVRREGRGLSFFYYAPVSSIIAIPLGSRDIQFIFSEATLDFQAVTIQGQVTYSIENPKQLAEMLDFTLAKGCKVDVANFEKLNQRLSNEAQTAVSAYIQGLGLKEALRNARAISNTIEAGLKSSDAVGLLGVSILGVNVLAVRPTPEMAKALETEMRESLQKEADQAIYERRNFAVEQERRIRESELNTEIAVQEKKKQIHEKGGQIKVKEAENARTLREMNVAADLAVEEQNSKLIEMLAQNERKTADARGYTLEKTLTPYKQLDWRVLMAINSKDVSAADNIGFAFRELAENSGKIGTLNITPDLLEAVIRSERKK